MKPTPFFAADSHAPARAWRRLGVLALSACAAMLPAPGTLVHAAESAMIDAASERAVKAAFIYKFQAYVEWPADVAVAGAPFVIGVMGADDIAADLTRISAGRTVNNRPTQVRTIKEADALNGIHLLYIGSADDAVLRRMLKEAQLRSILTVTDTDGALNLGSIINFRLIDNRVRFEVSFDTAEKSKLKLSSRLIPVAYHVQKVSQ